MKVYLVIASINELVNIKTSSLQGGNDCKLLVIDEGSEKIRTKNERILSDLPHAFYGPQEREEWFKDIFGSSYKKYLSVVPKRCHAETSFGFLVSYKQGADVVVEVDDDVRVPDTGFIKSHLKNLHSNDGVTVFSSGKWYNTVENLKLSVNDRPLPRGHPYAPVARVEDYEWTKNGQECVLNMGLWSGHLDLDALTILHNGGLDGRCECWGEGLKRDKVIVGKGTYFAVCSMNTSFRRKIIPAFYQFYMKYLGIDRFDDIWSGIFIKKIADQIGDNICLGKPIAYHDKRPRDTFKDLRAELEGMAINEILWRIVDRSGLKYKDYFSCCAELADHLEQNIQAFLEKRHRDFMKLQVDKMRLWLKVIEKVK